MSRDPRTYQNKNRIVTKTQEMLRGVHRLQQRELVAQQNLILKQQLQQIRQRQKQKRGQMGQVEPLATLPGVLANGQYGQHDEDDYQEPDKHSTKASPQPSMFDTMTIFVSIASYRDCECLPTVLDLFQKAEHPDRVSVGVYEQNDPETDKSFTMAHLMQEERESYPELVKRFDSEQLRIMFSPCVDAAGPMYARAKIEQNLFRNEQFYMIIDSHALFEPKWDTICLTEWHKAQQLSAKPILSYYPPNFDRTKRQRTPLQMNPNLKLDYLRSDKFDKNSGVPMPTKQAFINMPRQPLVSLFWTACFSFASSDMIENVPFDDQYPYLFLGEEICMNLRLYTHGYNVYNPTQHILYHAESREYRPTFWELFYANKKPMNASFEVTDDQRTERKNTHLASLKRVSQLIYNHADHDIPDQYGLGAVRSYQQFCDFIGINFEKQQAQEHTKYGRTKQLSAEEQYAKIIKNTSQPSGQPSSQPRNMMRPMNMQHRAIPTPMGGRPGSMTKMTGMTGGAAFDPAMAPKPKQIPRTRTGVSMQNKPWLRQAQTNQVNQAGKMQMPRMGPPQPMAYAKGAWGRA
jgi:hypothetical protein